MGRECTRSKNLTMPHVSLDFKHLREHYTSYRCHTYHYHFDIGVADCVAVLVLKYYFASISFFCHYLTWCKLLAWLPVAVSPIWHQPDAPQFSVAPDGCETPACRSANGGTAAKRLVLPRPMTKKSTTVE